ncbi:MAG: UDP-2,3-diacylglucosamine diphosphatase [Pseudomonadales bacterium]|nr:UDP-2,3-diacylglucosamine diphosphatase [Pseudomonadales bacterium]
MTTLFISDLHLDEKRPDISRAFFRFLETKAIHADQLYILGDFFEVWIGDDAISPFQEEVIYGLQNVSKHCNVFFMHGNRDFLVGNLFADLSGATLLPDPTIITLAGEKTLLMHGDSLCTGDTEYMQFRAMVRNPDWQAEFLGKSLEERIAIAKHLRDKSKEETANKEEYITDVTPSEVVKVMDESGCTRLIHGHTHRPARHPMEARERIVLGDWGATGWYIVCDGKSLELLEFNPL